MRQQLVNYFKACFPALAVQATDEQRAMTDVLAAAKEVGRDIITWSATEGLRDLSSPSGGIEDTQDLQRACQVGITLTTQGKRGIVFVIRDPQTWPFDRDPVLLRWFRDFLACQSEFGCAVVVVASSYQPHPTLEKMVVLLDYELPTREELARVVSEVAESAGVPADTSEPVLRALSGLTLTEAANALSLSVVQTKGFDTKVIYGEKVKSVRKTGLLDIVEPDPRGLDAVGGLVNFKAWIRRRAKVWSPKAKAAGVSDPKGVLLVGVPGTGKSLCAKAVGTALGIPTVKLDMGSMFNSLVGESERRIRDALALAEAISPCCLWLDEIDKGMAGANGSGSGDSGVTKRLFGTVITWMQERKRPVFLIATANDVGDLPAPLLRKGRFDEIFAVDLPLLTEREAVLRVQLEQRGKAVDSIDIASVAKATEEFTGAELEAVVAEALLAAFEVDRELDTTDLLTAAAATVPLAKTAKAQIDAIREWAKTNARPASLSPSTNGAAPAAPGKRKFSNLNTNPNA
jgi:hypothetical protein